MLKYDLQRYVCTMWLKRQSNGFIDMELLEVDKSVASLCMFILILCYLIFLYLRKVFQHYVYQ